MPYLRASQGGGGEISVAPFSSFSGITNTNKLTILCNIGDYIVISAYRSVTGKDIMWNGSIAAYSSDFISPAVSLSTNNFSFIFKASQASNEFYLGQTGATLSGGYSIITNQS